MDKKEGELSFSANKKYDAAVEARKDTEGWLHRVRFLEKQFCEALDIERTVPKQMTTISDMARSTVTMRDRYGQLITGTEEQLAGMQKSSDYSYALVAAHGICSLGKLCEAILAILPGTQAVSGFLKGTKTVLSSSKDLIDAKRAMDGGDGSGGSGKAIEASLKLLGEETATLADLIGGLFDMKVLSDPNNKDAIDYEKLAEKAASVVKTLKGVMGTLEKAIIALKHETKGSVRAGTAAKFLDVLENLLECYKNAVAAYDNYQKMMATAAEMGRTSAHISTLKRDYLERSYGSRKAFERAIFIASRGNQEGLEKIRIRFLQNINSHAEASKWAEELAAALGRYREDLKRAQSKVQAYG
ncbi:MAG: hypothetical protein K5905_11400, partial [Roseibium sp.]|uniref:hypothetical protein n=1 Tax=Roseibium sp. TaxID=1936156 RepID=UPI00261A6023